MSLSYINTQVSIQVTLEDKHIMTLSKVIPLPESIIIARRGAIELNVQLSKDRQFNGWVNINRFDAIENHATADMDRSVELDAINDVQTERFVEEVQQQGWEVERVPHPIKSETKDVFPRIEEVKVEPFLSFARLVFVSFLLAGVSSIFFLFHDSYGEQIPQDALSITRILAVFSLITAAFTVVYAIMIKALFWWMALPFKAFKEHKG